MSRIPPGLPSVVVSTCGGPGVTSGRVRRECLVCVRSSLFVSTSSLLSDTFRPLFPALCSNILTVSVEGVTPSFYGFRDQDDGVRQTRGPQHCRKVLSTVVPRPPNSFETRVVVLGGFRFVGGNSKVPAKRLLPLLWLWFRCPPTVSPVPDPWPLYLGKFICIWWFMNLFRTFAH